MDEYTLYEIGHKIDVLYNLIKIEYGYLSKIYLNSIPSSGGLNRAHAHHISSESQVKHYKREKEKYRATCIEMEKDLAALKEMKYNFSSKKVLTSQENDLWNHLYKKYEYLQHHKLLRRIKLFCQVHIRVVMFVLVFIVVYICMYLYWKIKYGV